MKSLKKIISWLRTRAGRRWLISLSCCLLIVGIVWLYGPISLGHLRKHNPERTAMMKFREAQARSKHRKYHIRQHWVSLDHISTYLQKAVLIAEDDTFYEHRGVDFQETLDSLKDNWKRKHYARGGSTITQQVAKNLFLSPHKFLLRKLKEMLLAFRLEHALGKKRILEIYLNIAEWGPGIFGAETAAREYFGKSAADLNLEEAVALAAVLPSPLRHSPVQAGRYLKWRTGMIMSRLERWGELPPSASVLPESEPEWVSDEETGDEISDNSEKYVAPEVKSGSYVDDTPSAVAVMELPGPELINPNSEVELGAEVALPLSNTAQ